MAFQEVLYCREGSVVVQVERDDERGRVPSVPLE